MAIMLSMESMIAISSRRGGGGGAADLSRPAFQKNFCAICRSFLFPETRAVL